MPKTINTLSRRELYDLAWSKSLTRIAKEYNLPYPFIIELFKKYDIAYPESGHWMKLKFNKEVNIIPLSKTDKETLIISIEDELKKYEDLKPIIKINRKEKEIKKKLDIIPEKLLKPHPLIKAAKDDLKNKKPSHYHDYNGLIVTSNNIFNLVVTKETTLRALIFSDILVKAFLKRGHQIKVSDNTRIIIDGESYKICVRESRKRIKVETDYSWKRTEYVPTGVLTLRLEDLYRYEWKDTKTSKLEEKLPKIIAYFEERAIRERAERIEREKYWAEQERKRQIKKDSYAKKEKELKDFKSLLRSSERWKKATDLRNYINEVELVSIENSTLSDNLKNWLKWANNKADWYDPLIEREDELLNSVDKNKLELEKEHYW